MKKEIIWFKDILLEPIVTFSLIGIMPILSALEKVILKKVIIWFKDILLERIVAFSLVGIMLFLSVFIILSAFVGGDAQATLTVIPFFLMT